MSDQYPPPPPSEPTGPAGSAPPPPPAPQWGDTTGAQPTPAYAAAPPAPAVALILAIFVSIVMPYLTSAEVGGLYKRRGQKEPVSGVTGLWYFPGMFILVGPIIWFVKTNGALNDYWKSLGAQG